MKSSPKSVGKELAHVAATTDALPQNPSRPVGYYEQSDRIWDLPSEPIQLSNEQIKNAEDDFRSFIKSKLPQSKAPAHLLQKIRQNILLSE